jgi:ABC-type cobalamin transport system permease subunit
MARFLLAGIALEIAGVASITWAVIALIGSA